MKATRRLQDEIESGIAELARIDRTTPDHQADATMMRKLFGIEPDELSDQEFDFHLAKIVCLALDASGIRARARVLRARREGDGASVALGAEDYLDAGIDAETTSEREALLALHGMTDPALLPDELDTAAPELAQQPANKQPGSLTLDDAKCLDALSRLERGATRKELAEHYDRGLRTIYTWLKRAEELRLTAFNERRPDEKLAEASHDFQVIRADLLKKYDKASRKGHNSLSLEILRELRAWRQQHFEMMTAIGFFEHYRHPATVHEIRKAAVRRITEGL